MDELIRRINTIANHYIRQLDVLYAELSLIVFKEMNYNHPEWKRIMKVQSREKKP